MAQTRRTLRPDLPVIPQSAVRCGPPEHAWAAARVVEERACVSSNIGRAYKATELFAMRASTLLWPVS
jgi:hypothetical protein